MQARRIGDALRMPRCRPDTPMLCPPDCSPCFEQYHSERDRVASSPENLLARLPIGSPTDLVDQFQRRKGAEWTAPKTTARIEIKTNPRSFHFGYPLVIAYPGTLTRVNER